MNATDRDEATPLGRRAHAVAWGTALGIGFILVLLLAGTWGEASAPTGATSSLTVTPESHSYPTAIRHVIVIVMENAENTNTLRFLPFERNLSTTFAYANDYYSACHPSPANYIALTSGSTFTQCGSNSLHAGQFNTTNIGDLADAAGLSWAGFFDSMPQPCYGGNVGEYASVVNPFLYYPDIWAHKVRCRAHDLPLTSFFADVNNSSVPSYSLIVPNLIDDGHDADHNYSDHWLANFTTQWIFSQSYFSTTAVIITYDEGLLGTGYTAGGYTLKGGKIYTVLVSPYSVGVDSNTGHPFANNSGPFNTLSTTEWLLGLGSTGNHDSTSATAAYPPMFAMIGSTYHAFPAYAYTWTNLSISGPSGRAETSMTYDAADQEVVLFGGHSTSVMSDTWTYANGSWTKLNPTSHPSPRRGAMVTYDAACGCVVLFGGSGATYYYNDTWTFKAGVWTNITASVGNPMDSRRVGQIAYDPANGEIVLFGGHGGVGRNVATYTFLDDTWVLPANLSGQWTQLHPRVIPGIRGEPFMTYDPAVQKIVLFGGYDLTATWDDTWVFSNGSWTQLYKSDVAGPGSRDGGDMVWDPALNGVVLFGGHDLSVFTWDTWLFNGTAWKPLFTWPDPSHRATDRVAYYAPGNYLLMYGGELSDGGYDLSDTWTFT